MLCAQPVQSVDVGGVAMKRPVLIGGGLAVLVLVVVFFAGWAVGGRDGSVAVGSVPQSTTGLPARSEPPGSAGSLSGFASEPPSSMTPQIAGTQAPAAVVPITADERRKRLAQVRSDISAMMASGALGSPEKALPLINELEQLSQGSADPRYFQALRSMLDSTTKVQALSAELQKISGSSKPEDIARRQEVLSQLQQLSTRISAEAADLQSGARRAANAGKS